MAVTEAIHFYQQLVQGLLALIMATAHSRATLTPDGVDLVDKDDAWRIFFGLREQVTNAGCTHTDEHFDEV